MSDIGTLPRATPESQGVSSAALLECIEALDSRLRNVHGVVIVRRGQVIAEGWWAPYRGDRRHALFSVSKSFTSTAIGLLVEEGRLALDDRVVDLLPDDAPPSIDDRLARLQVRHLLSMSTGHEADVLDDVPSAGGWARYLLAPPVTHEPGSRFLYETGATYLLAVIATRLAGVRLLDYLTPRLFAPLGIEGATWERSPDGIDVGGFGLSATTRDIATFGELLLRRGAWRGRQLVPAWWVTTATSAHVSNGDPSEPSDWSQGYGFQLWRGQHGSFRADGAFGQLCVVLPGHETVVAVSAGLPDMQEELDVVWDTLLPALGDRATLPPDPVAHDRLGNRLAALSLPTPRGASTSPRAVMGHAVTYRFDGTQGIARLELSAGDGRVEVALDGPGVEGYVVAGHERWLEGGRAFPDGLRPGTDRRPGALAAAYAWPADDRLELTAWAVDTAFCWTITMDFRDDDHVAIEFAQNVAFGPPPVIRATGRRAHAG